MFTSSGSTGGHGGDAKNIISTNTSFGDIMSRWVLWMLLRLFHNKAHRESSDIMMRVCWILHCRQGKWTTPLWTTPPLEHIHTGGSRVQGVDSVSYHDPSIHPIMTFKGKLLINISKQHNIKQIWNKYLCFVLDMDLLNVLRPHFCTLTTHSWSNWGDEDDWWGWSSLTKNTLYGDFVILQAFDFIECFTTTFLRAHSWLNWVDEDDDEHDEVGLKEKPEDTRYIKKITSK